MTDTASRAQGVCALLADGSTVRLRPACPQDRGRLLRLYEEMSADNLHSRFFVVSRRSGEQAADRLHSRPLPAGTRVAVVSNAGGAGVLAADACVDAGLTVPELPSELVGELLTMLPGGAGAGNSADTAPAVGVEALSGCVQRLAQSAARALLHAAERARWLVRPQGSVVEPTGADSSGTRAVVDGFLARDPAGGWLDARATDELFARYGIPRLRQVCAANEQEAVDAAARLVGADGGVALKAQGLETASRCAALPYGYRGSGPADVGALEDLLARPSRMLP
ncbi:hypothetical protein [Streptomyces decoyicus]|uniref:hypothetical protein n=1 Tax=Streptomyces decoyicus TaxID=249567 RepID=UPI00386B9A1F|nr:hypothetical protein OG532_37120 [Streptomyces decoyicus]